MNKFTITETPNREELFTTLNQFPKLFPDVINVIIGQLIRVDVKAKGDVNNEDLLLLFSTHLLQVAWSEYPKTLRITSLDLSGTNVTNLSNITELNDIWRTILREKYGVNEIREINGLTELNKLDLHYTQVSDLTPFSCLTNLRDLDLFHTQVSDLTPLYTLINLKKIVVPNSLNEQVLRLQRILPQLVIDQ